MTVRVSVIGSGSFGTAMAHLFAKKGHDVHLWTRDAAIETEINSFHTNRKYTGDFVLAESITSSLDLSHTIANSDFVLFSIPCQHLRLFLRHNKSILQQSKAIFVNLAKGIEIDSLRRPSQIFGEELGESALSRYAIISGPTFAKELLHEQPTGAAVASVDPAVALRVQKELSLFFFRLYTASDLIGVELGGAIKNVMAICVGVIEGIGYGMNARAGLITRCLHEMTELGVALGAKERTFSGLSGIGDLILTCTGDLSRNRQVGLRLGRGESVDTILKTQTHVAEGVPTSKSVFLINQKCGVPMPNAEHVYRVLFEGLPAKEAVHRILSRELKTEFGPI